MKRIELKDHELAWLIEAIEGKPCKNLDGAKLKGELMVRFADKLGEPPEPDKDEE